MGKVIKWFIITLAVGSIPMLMRGFVYFLLIENSKLQPVLTTDVIVLGLVLNIAIFNERHDNFRYTPSISEASSTSSLILIVLFSLMFFCTLVNEVMLIFSQEALTIASVVFVLLTVFLCIVFIIFCYPYLKKKAILEVAPLKEE